jgi:hypothetical protein
VPRRISPFFVPASIINMISGHISIRYGFTGPNMAIVTACTTGLHCIGAAGRLIEYGDADVMIAGGAESTVSPLGIGGFAAARALSTRNDDPKTASRPWDKDRDGFVLGEGAGVLVLEEYEHAKARGAKIYAELAGFGMGADAFHMTAPNVDGPKRSMMAACAMPVNADEVHYLNAHGTSTPLGDLNETNAIKLALGEHAQGGGQFHQVDDRSPAGRRRRHRVGVHGAGRAPPGSPPTINIFNQDPECDLDYCANEAREHEDRCRGEEQLRLRRHQRYAGVPARLTSQPVHLRWTGASWQMSTGSGGGFIDLRSAEVAVDAGALLVLRLRPASGSAAAWIAVTRTEAGPDFRALCVALYAASLVHERPTLAADGPRAR